MLTRSIQRFAFAIASVATALALCFGLSACSGAGSTPAAPSLPKEDVVGIWNITSSAVADFNDEGLYSFYKFEDDGTFILETILKDSSLTREGTWEIKDDKVIVNLPELDVSDEDSEGPIVGLSADAVVDGEVTIDEGTLTTSDISTDSSETTAEKIDQAKYDEIVAECAAMGPLAISVGERVSGDACAFTVDSFQYQDAIYPSDTSSYYTYYDDEPDSTYLVAQVSYTNTANQYAVIGYATEATIQIGDNVYEAAIELDAGTLFGKSYRLEAQQSGKAIIYASIPDTVVDSGETTLTWNIPKDASLLQTFYQSSFDSNTYELTL